MLNVGLLLLAAGTYQVPGGAQPVNVVAGDATEQCYRLAPKEVFVVDGPATIELAVRLDARGRRVRPAKLAVEVDATTTKHRVRARRQKGAAYDPPIQRSTPSAPAKAIRVEVPDGAHQVTVRILGRRRSGCVVLNGVALASPQPESEPEPVAEAPVAAEPTPAASSDASADVSPEAVTEPAATEEIYAVAAAQPVAVHEEAPASESTAEAGLPWVRLGPTVGGLLPRGDLKPTLFVGAMIEVPIISLLSAYTQVGWSPYRQTGEHIVPGRGQAQIVQNTRSVPLEIGVRLRLDFGLPVIPYAVVGFAMDFSRTEVLAFSGAPDVKNDVAVGVAAALGAALPLGTGELFLEFRYRETNTDLGSISSVAEQALGHGAVQLGYAIAIGS